MTAKLFDLEIIVTLFTLHTPPAARVENVIFAATKKETESELLDLIIISHQNPEEIFVLIPSKSYPNIRRGCLKYFPNDSANLGRSRI